jgi:hypothetical protein
MKPLKPMKLTITFAGLCGLITLKDRSYCVIMPNGGEDAGAKFCDSPSDSEGHDRTTGAAHATTVLVRRAYVRTDETSFLPAKQVYVDDWYVEWDLAGFDFDLIGRCDNDVGGVLENTLISMSQLHSAATVKPKFADRKPIRGYSRCFLPAGQIRGIGTSGVVPIGKPDGEIVQANACEGLEWAGTFNRPSILVRSDSGCSRLHIGQAEEEEGREVDPNPTIQITNASIGSNGKTHFRMYYGIIDGVSEAQQCWITTPNLSAVGVKPIWECVPPADLGSV